MKPPEFCVWMFRQLGARAGDELIDVFPGSGAVSRAWALYASCEASAAAGDASLLEQHVDRDETPRGDPRDASLLASEASRSAAAIRPAGLA